MTAEVTTFEGRMAREIDRLVVGGHGRAAAWPAIAALRDDPIWVQGATLLFPSAAVVLLRRRLTGKELARIIPYFRPERAHELFEANVAVGALEADGALTPRGKDIAELVVAAQEEAVADVWALTPEPLARAADLLVGIARHVESLTPLRSPSVVELFHGTSERPTPAGRLLRSITLVRYWRMDAHFVAQEAAGLSAPEGHALNRAWMAAEGTGELPGQGTARMGEGATRALNERELFDGENITTAGRAVRDRIEAHTDELTAPAYASLNEAQRDELYGSLTTLPI